MRGRFPSALAIVLMCSATPRATAEDVSAAGVALLERWSNAVASHTPRRLDEGLDHVMALTYEDRRALDAPMRIFLSVLAGRGNVPVNALEKRIDALARGFRSRSGYEPFLKRAVMLHSDAAVAGERAPQPMVDVPASPGLSVSPLLATRRRTISRDGEIIGNVESDWNWPFARSLADAIHAIAPADPFVAAWYHATAAYMFSRLQHAELKEHLSSAARILPDDARILFDRASYFDGLSLPALQVLLRGVDLAAVRRAQRGQRLPPSTSAATRRATALDIPPKSDALRDAEALFRRALRADPAFAEARVRLARVLIERGRYAEALTESDAALAARPSEAVAFHGHLFAGRAAQGVGRHEEAGRHFDAASQLFPLAQSAMLARSQLALLSADANAASAALEGLPKDPSPDALHDDPWVDYRLAIGREWESLYRGLRIE